MSASNTPKQPKSILKKKHSKSKKGKRIKFNDEAMKYEPEYFAIELWEMEIEIKFGWDYDPYKRKYYHEIDEELEIRRQKRREAYLAKKLKEEKEKLETEILNLQNQKKDTSNLTPSQSSESQSEQSSTQGVSREGKVEKMLDFSTASNQFLERYEMELNSTAIDLNEENETTSLPSQPIHVPKENPQPIKQNEPPSKEHFDVKKLKIDGTSALLKRKIKLKKLGKSAKTHFPTLKKTKNKPDDSPFPGIRFHDATSNENISIPSNASDNASKEELIQEQELTEEQQEYNEEYGEENAEGQEYPENYQDDYGEDYVEYEEGYVEEYGEEYGEEYQESVGENYTPNDETADNGSIEMEIENLNLETVQEQPTLSSQSETNTSTEVVVSARPKIRRPAPPPPVSRSISEGNVMKSKYGQTELSAISSSSVENIQPESDCSGDEKEGGKGNGKKEAKSLQKNMFTKSINQMHGTLRKWHKGKGSSSVVAVKIGEPTEG